MISGVSASSAYYAYPTQALGSAEAQGTHATEPPSPGTDAGNNPTTDKQTQQADDKTSKKSTPKSANGEQLSEEQWREVEKLKQRDREVRAHEAAHLAAAGPYARGGMSFSYQTGPDGMRYAVGGEVGIDTSPIKGDPRATLQKANTLRAAAMAPAEPSSQDHAVAAQATQMAAQARQEIIQEQSQKLRGNDSEHRSDSNADKGTEKNHTDNTAENTRQAQHASNQYHQVENGDRKKTDAVNLDLRI
ncbi:MAG: putative metalloprotease CJM1_0395 family protein [Gammaproteobacteria bacterium]|nr:putative metalloprotease CJM1_0395 family protein [Gammaproteobacteria bacterium]